MGLHKNSSRKKSECRRNVVSKLLELNCSRDFRKFETLYKILNTEGKNNNQNKCYFKDELELYKEEILYGFSVLSKKNTIISLC